MSQFDIKIITSIADINTDDWQKLKPCPSKSNTPFISREFLMALESSGSVGHNTGWLPQHLAIFSGEDLLGLQISYLKTHSYGEYVFDHAWANAYHQHQIPYYPKLVSCIPFTPVTGSKLLINRDYQAKDVVAMLYEQIPIIVNTMDSSSWHGLFWPEKITNECPTEFAQRTQVQFEWHNRAYSNFDAFLSQLKARKRKMITKERESVKASGISIRRLVGAKIDEAAMHRFTQCYQATYIKRSGHTGYLTPEFFQQIRSTMPNNILLVEAYQDNSFVAAALCFVDDKALYGRYWGALQDISHLHFECCYYQGIEFAIENKLSLFNPGTQGEHKLARGFEAINCHSYHYLVHPDFQQAVINFCAHERELVADYAAECVRATPYKS